jgi:hypothetical protein
MPNVPIGCTAERSLLKSGPELQIRITQLAREQSRRGSDLLRNPFRCRMAGDIDPDQISPD